MYITINSALRDGMFLLRRLGLCSKSLCEKALETTNWDLEKAASALLDQ